ncbi:fasciclin-like arabinogalactan protein [Striga asiatica]|uniref:Fasciclin-like arabinogalactan protein n=1 Tax=Striga asiatica TaxID=4170 RepID=A0A5A7QP82_STRAF|nr:fasciclin-like arabinogalactan protein [Striga asiatica]
MIRWQKFFVFLSYVLIQQLKSRKIVPDLNDEIVKISILLSLSSTPTTTLTIFSTPDSAFSTFGQPSLAHLLLHFSPFSLSPQSLLSLPFSSTVPSLSPVSHLVVTSGQPEQISINNVEFSDTPIFDDGFVFVYAIDGRARFAAEINYFSAHRRTNHLGSGDYREFEMIPGFAVLFLCFTHRPTDMFFLSDEKRGENGDSKAFNQKAMEDIAESSGLNG